MPSNAGRWLALVVLSGAFVLVAVVLETVGGTYANSSVPSWAEMVPLAWPQPARIAWWTTVAGAAGAFRLGLQRLGFRQRPLVVVASVLPFLAFAVGIAIGADWSTWH